ncbi:hypothetical protein FRC08_001066 [Ceratobasidium sp. 394]|nr:hypothetical protein FRC08_001066 [Ceratobasidium sp. 394]
MSPTEGDDSKHSCQSIRDTPLKEDVEVDEDGEPITLSSRRAKLLNTHPNDFFYQDFVQLVNETAGLGNSPSPAKEAYLSDSDSDSSSSSSQSTP